MKPERPAQLTNPGPIRLGKYALVRPLARGGMAEIYLAREVGIEGFQRSVVVKRVLPQVAQDPQFVEMFLDEARLAAQLQHPNIAHIYDFGKAEGFYYLAMEYIHGATLSQIRRRLGARLFPVEHALKIIGFVCDGLDYAHSLRNEQGEPMHIVHRDISPQNVLVSFDGGVKLLDFGIAKATTQMQHTQSGVLKGKFAYMSPEQYQARPLDGRSDLFGVGVLLFEMLSGESLFERTDPASTMQAVMTQHPMRLSMLRTDVPPGLDALMHRALAKDPAARFQSAGEMQMEIEQLMADNRLFSNSIAIAHFLSEVFERVTDRGRISLPPSADTPPPSYSPSGVHSSPPVSLVPAVDEIDLDAGAFEQQPTMTPGKGVSTPFARGNLSEPGVERRPPRARVWMWVPLLLAAAVGATWWVARHPRLGRVLQSRPVASATAPAPALATPTEPGSAAPPTVPLPSTQGAAPEPLPEPSPSAPTAGKSPRPAEHATRRAPSGELYLNTDPWTTVMLGSQRIGTTPMIARPMPAGSYVLTLIDREGRRYHERVDIVSGRATKRFVDLSARSPPAE